MRIVRDAKALSAILPAPGTSHGFVPTMGALHAGHLSLVAAARGQCDFVSVSVFVNPLQFGAGEDLDTYPRDEDGDLGKLREAGVDLVLLGTTADMYPQDFSTSVEVSGVTGDCEGAIRPGHFRGVTTVVAKLFLLFRPTRAYFGWKDMQQCCVIRRMVADLAFPVQVVPCEVVREPDGLALSSRNAYLGPEDRAKAPRIQAALQEARASFEAGTTTGAALVELVQNRLADDFDVDYVEIRDEADFARVPDPIDRGRIVVAARIAGVRLLDNLPLVREGRA